MPEPVQRPATPPPCVRAPGSFAEIAQRLKTNVVVIVAADAEPPAGPGPAGALPMNWQATAAAPPAVPPTDEAPSATGHNLGTGFLLGPEAMVVTSTKVLGQAAELAVLLHDGRRIAATLRGTDDDLDVALLMLEEPVAEAEALTDCTRIRPGDWVAVLANPFGNETTVTAGLVRFSATPNVGQPHHHALLRRFMGVDATIDAANWGGPVVDTAGRLVGLAVAAPRAGSSVSLVLPTDRLRRSVSQLAQHGHPARTWIGLWVRPLDRDGARALGIDPPRGLLVTRVAPGGPAHEAGIEPQDVILELFGEQVSTPAALGALASRAAPEQTIPLLVVRDGRNRTLRLRPAPMPQ